jgi:hypothetical protein
MVLWIAVAVVVVLLLAVLPRKKSWGPVTYQRRSLIGGPVSGRILAVGLTVALIVLVLLAVTH